MRAWTCGWATAGARRAARWRSGVPVSIARITWAGDRLLYGAVVDGKPADSGSLRRAETPEDGRLDAQTPAATRDGRTIVFVSSVEAPSTCGRATQPVVESPNWYRGTPEQVVVTPDDTRRALHLARRRDGLDMDVPLAGGTPTKLADAAGAAVSPDGRTIAFVGRVGGSEASLVVCSLPGCTSPRTVGAARPQGNRLGHPTVAGWHTRVTAICGCRRSREVRRVRSRASPTAPDRIVSRGRATASAWPSRE